MSISKHTRFEVFKRDDFTCQYCGRKVPDVTLEADHIVPRAEGGGDEFENLTTSCEDCNRGKAGVPLDTREALLELSERTERMREREEQLRAYNEVKAIERTRRDRDFVRVWQYWFAVYGSPKKLPYWECPRESIVQHYLGHLPVEEVMDAVDVTAARFPRSCGAAPKYFGGVLRQKLKNARGES